MGSGISLSKTQVITIIKRTVKKEFYDKEFIERPLYVNGYIAYYDFGEEVKYNKTIQLLNNILDELESTQ